MKSPFRFRVAIGAVLLLTPVLGGCGFDVQTDQVYQAAVGTDERGTSIDVLNGVVVTNGTGQGTFAGSLVNSTSTPDALTGVTAEEGLQIVSGGDVIVPAYGLVNLSTLLENGKIPLVIDGAPVEAGGFVTLTFTFTSADPVTTTVPVVDNTAEGEDYHQVPLAPTDGVAPSGEKSAEKSEAHSEDDGTEP